MSFIVKDERERVILSMNSDGRLAAGRHPDMSETCKTCILDVYRDLTDENIDEVRKFLDYEEDEEFCS